MNRYRFKYFAKNMGKIIGKNRRKKLCGIYSQKFMGHGKQSRIYNFATVAIKAALKREIQKLIKASGDLIVKKTVYKVTKVSRDLRQNNSETIATKNIEFDGKIPKER